MPIIAMPLRKVNKFIMKYFSYYIYYLNNNKIYIQNRKDKIVGILEIVNTKGITGMVKIIYFNI